MMMVMVVTVCRARNTDMYKNALERKLEQCCFGNGHTFTK